MMMRQDGQELTAARAQVQQVLEHGSDATGRWGDAARATRGVAAHLVQESGKN